VRVSLHHNSVVAPQQGLPGLHPCKDCGNDAQQTCNQAVLHLQTASCWEPGHALLPVAGLLLHC
jgi:hypothetical protein